MSDQLKEKLTSEIDTCSWSLLDAHYLKGTVFIIDNELDLVDVGTALANDNVERVKAWREGESLRSPGENEVTQWREDPQTKHFKFLIIQPFVIIQLLKLN